MENKNAQLSGGLDYNSPEKVLLYLKKNHDRAMDLLLAYLDDLPVIEMAHSTRGKNRDRCDAWIVATADLVKQRCADCIHKDACAYQCIDCLIAALPKFCAICQVTDKQVCFKKKAARLDLLKEANRTFAEPFDGLRVYDCRLGFAKWEAFTRKASILTLPLPLYTPVASMGVAWPLKLQGQLHRWFKELDLAGKDDISLMDLACSVAAFTYLFLGDLYEKSLYMGLSAGPSEPKNTGNNESANVLFAGMAKRDGLSEDEIIEILAHNENQDELLLGGGASAYTKSWIIDPAEAEGLIDSVLCIYACPVLPEFELNKIDPQISNKLDNLCRKGFLRKTNVRLTENGAANPSRIDFRYLHYRIYLLLAALLGVAKATRFTNQIAQVFQGENLIDLWKHLHAGDTLKDACKKIHRSDGKPISASAVIQALDRHKELHPRYHDYRNKLDSTKNHDTKLFLAEYTLEDMITWRDKVNKLKIE